MTSESDITGSDIAGLRHQITSGEVTVGDIVEATMRRIEANDQRGATLNSIVSVNPRALDDAHQLDEQSRQVGSSDDFGPLHGVPIVIKDCIETRGIPTSYGSAAFAHYSPSQDASVVKKLRQAGAVIIGKATMPDWATSWFSYSSRSGMTKNPYSLDHDPGGSSSGTGTAVASGFSTVGLGTDTGGSIRLPASFCGLVGVRATPGLISRSGCSPLIGPQDTVGPMARTVADAVKVFEVLIGYDPTDPQTAAYSIASRLLRDTGARDPKNRLSIGLVSNMFGSDSDGDSAEVNGIIRGALGLLDGETANVVPVELPNLDSWIERTALAMIISRQGLNEWFAAKLDFPIASFDVLMAESQYHPKLDFLEAVFAGPAEGRDTPEYYRASTERIDFTRFVVNQMELNGLDVLAYPTSKIAAPKTSDLDRGLWDSFSFPLNTLLSSQSWTPSISVPVGFTRAGLPVGIELLARPFAERTMFQVASRIEAAVVGSSAVVPIVDRE